MKRTLPIALLFMCMLIWDFPNHFVYADSFETVYDIPPNVQKCDPGVLKESEKQKVLTYVNYIRELHHLQPVVYDYEHDDETAQAALLIVANNRMTHTPSSGSLCFSQTGYDGSSTSNLMRGPLTEISETPLLDRSTADVRGWLIDDEVPSLGHRQWLLDPFLTQISYGRVANTTTDSPSGQVTRGAALKVVYEGKAPLPIDSPTFVAYPYGNYPLDLFKLDWYWSFSVIADGNDVFNNKNVDYRNAEITVTSGDDEHRVTNISYDNRGVGISNLLQWRVENVAMETRYHVRIDNVAVLGESKSYEYDIQITTPYYSDLDVPVYTLSANKETMIEVKAGSEFALFFEPPLADLGSYRLIGQGNLETAQHSAYVRIYRVTGKLGTEILFNGTSGGIRVAETIDGITDPIITLQQELTEPLYVITRDKEQIGVEVGTKFAVHVPESEGSDALSGVRWNYTRGMQVEGTFYDANTLMVAVKQGAIGDEAEFRLSDGRTFTVKIVTAQNVRPTPTSKPLPTATPTVPPTPTPIATATPTAAPVTATPTLTPTPQRIHKLEVLVNTLNVRSGPGTTYATIGQISNGTIVEVPDENSDGTWLQICCLAGQRGWVINRTDYVRLFDEDIAE